MQDEITKRLHEEYERATAVIVFDDGEAKPYHAELPTPPTMTHEGKIYLKTQTVDASEVNKETWWYYSADYILDLKRQLAVSRGEE